MGKATAATATPIANRETRKRESRRYQRKENGQGVCGRCRSPAADSIGPQSQLIVSEAAGIPPLAITLTTVGQENAEDPQVLNAKVLPSPVSFQAEGTGFKPSTGCPAPHFEPDSWSRCHYAQRPKV